MDASIEPSRGGRDVVEDQPSVVDRAVDLAADKAEELRTLGAAQKAELLEQVTRGLAGVSADVVALGCAAKGITRGAPAEAEEWFAGPAVMVSLARYHTMALRALAKNGKPMMPSGWIERPKAGSLFTRLPPLFAGGGVIESGVSFRVLHQAGTTKNDVIEGQKALAAGPKSAGTTAVLGAGNVASIPVADVIHALFVEGRTAVLKMNPVNAYLREPFERAMAPLIAKGYVQIVDGGAEVGAHLVNHPRVTHVHLTGSAETHDRIVWGPPGPEREARKAKNQPVSTKEVTSELGNVSPILVTPYLYSRSDLAAMAEMIATQLTNNASFNCNAGKMLVLPRGFPQRKMLLDALVRLLEKVPVRKAYYPGAADRWRSLTGGRDGVVKVGSASDGELPWTLITEVDPASKDEVLFFTEPFCSLLSVVEVGSLDPVEYLDQAVTFCNERLWGTLSACLFVPPLFEDDGVVEHAVDKAIARLEYGAVGVNLWPALVYATPRAPWGGHPKATLADVQSGIGFVHNPLMLPRIEKAVVRGPLVPIPKQPYIVGHKHGLAAAKSLVAHAESPSLGGAFGVVKSTLFG